ncbi:LIC_10190 family membrane protein [Flavobacterium sp. 25HG05S-40]|uniref:LIC_10190 family membrane protein n=1 Tax=Flavobacterium sp. 25HG05S-40 TaxID=3458682 RepID=UPI004044198B
MILILLSWIYVFFTATAFGIAFSKVVRIQRFDVVMTSILGLFSITILATVWAFIDSIALAFHSILLVLSLLFWFNNKTTFASILTTGWNQIRSFSLPIKLLLAVSSVLILAQSATFPFIIDNESYYVQTIKWLNEYGFVKGLANLHLFLGQTSGWHITQSVYSFSFLYDRFNDLNGFCFLLVNLFAFQKLQHYFKTSDRMDLVFGLLPVTYLLLFQFVSAPSPDLPIYLLAFLLFSEYLQNDNKKECFTIISILALYMVFIKVTSVVILIFPLILWIRNFKVVKNEASKIMLIGFVVLVLFVSKNTILTGYPLFPLLNFRLDAFEYTVPSIIMDFFFSKSMLHSFYIPNNEFETMSVWEIIKHYFLANRLLGFVAVASLVLLFVTPFVVIKKRLTSKIWTIYVAFILTVVLLSFSSPQYRFYIYFSLFFLLLVVSLVVFKPKWILGLLSASLIFTAMTLLTPLNFNRITSNNFMAQNNTFRFKNILIPEPVSRWKPEYRGGSVGNMHYHSPLDTSFFWVTGNGKLPCINALQLEYFHKGFFYIPQQRSIELKNGFYSQKVSGNE